MFGLVLGLVVVGAAAHALRLEDRTRESVAEVVLLWVLVGYCGVPMLVVSLGLLVHPGAVPHVLGLPAGGLFETFFGWAYLGMSGIAVLALRYRGAYLIGPAVLWSVFFLGATGVHLGDLGRRGEATHGGVLWILATHGLVSAVLLGALVASGRLRRRG